MGIFSSSPTCKQLKKKLERLQGKLRRWQARGQGAAFSEETVLQHFLVINDHICLCLVISNSEPGATFSLSKDFCNCKRFRSLSSQWQVLNGDFDVVVKNLIPMQEEGGRKGVGEEWKGGWGAGALEFEKGQKLPPTARALRAHTCQIAPIWDLYPSSNSRHKSESTLSTV